MKKSISTVLALICFISVHAQQTKSIVYKMTKRHDTSFNRQVKELHKQGYHAFKTEFVKDSADYVRLYFRKKNK